jgi:tetrahydrodipicolinate N-succinyltransferase
MFTEPLPSNDRGDTQDTESEEGFYMRHAVEMGLGVMIYMPSFLNIGSGIQS